MIEGNTAMRWERWNESKKREYEGYIEIRPDPTEVDLRTVERENEMKWNGDERDESVCVCM